ncbi:PA3496 family putative envelope integrity protein [Halomonas sp. C05BenzN]|uniref:PA3496 family putative envelope integrity protein n=1 Tax=Halomonas sp. C05BenzN TaxID=3411041 RepID=UPI003B952D89
MSREPLVNDSLDDEQDYQEAVNDDDYGRSRPTSRADTLRARRRVESLLEERRLRRAIEDDWMLLDDDEEE